LRSAPRVWIVSGDYPPVRSGEASHAFHLARRMAARGVAVRVVTSRLSGFAPSRGVEVDAAIRDWSWRALPRLRRRLRADAPDAVLLLHLPSMYGHRPMPTFLPTLSKRWLPGVRFVTQFESLGAVERPRPASARLAARLAGRSGVDPKLGTLLRDSDRIVVLSEEPAARLAHAAPAARERFTLVPAPPLLAMAPDAEAARRLGRERLKVDPGTFLLVYYGFVYPGRGLEHAVEALRRLVARGRDARLVVVGGPLDHVQTADVRRNSARQHDALVARVRGSEVARRVHWAGPCDAHDPTASVHLYAADAFVFPSDRGVHLNNSSVAAAAAHGLPLVATRAPTSEAAFRHGDNGLLVPPGDPDALADALESLIDSPALRARLAAGARALAVEHFDWDRAVARTLAALEVA